MMTGWYTVHHLVLLEKATVVKALLPNHQAVLEAQQHTPSSATNLRLKCDYGTSGFRIFLIEPVSKLSEW